MGARVDAGGDQPPLLASPPARLRPSLDIGTMQDAPNDDGPWTFGSYPQELNRFGSRWHRRAGSFESRGGHEGRERRW
jgi:hypothetical protein